MRAVGEGEDADEDVGRGTDGCRDPETIRK